MSPYFMSPPSKSEFLQMLEHFPQLIFWVSASEDVFLGCNNKFSSFVGLTDPSEIINNDGLMYFEKEDVMLFREYKNQIITHKKLISSSQEISNKLSGQIILDLTIAPIFDEVGEVKSLVCFGTPLLQLSDKPWSTAIKLINKENISKLLSNTSKFIINTEKMGKIHLTRREAECALYVMKGLTAKAISTQVFLAERTVINHIENIKNKTGCAKKSELITMFTEGNFIENNF